jgi:histidinol-phosphate aminotransferase
LDDVEVVQPVPALTGMTAYSTPKHPAPIDLHLDGNEGVLPPEALLQTLEGLGADELRRYPDALPLEEALARRFGVDPVRVVVTAGGDDALERAVRAVVGPGRNLVLPVPSFEMLGRFARLSGGDVVELPWPEGTPFPILGVLAAITPDTAAVAVVSPNNPTGGVATAEDILRIARAAPGVLVLADLAYVEFADEDPTPHLLDLPNVAVFRTMSKAWSLAGLRVGYAIATPEVAGWMRATGLPYPCSRPSLALAGARVASGEAAMRRFTNDVRNERNQLSANLAGLGATVFPSQANFILARFDDALFVRDGLAGQGIAVRAFPGNPRLEGRLRITCPGDAVAFARLQNALQITMNPQALLFDMDGVLADVSDSYRQAIIDAAAAFGVHLSAQEVAKAKREPGSNNDWVVTRRLLAARGVDATLEEVTVQFETAYQGSDAAPGLWTRESLAVPHATLERLAARLPLGIVTGRPRGDAERFLRHAGIDGLFSAVVCMGDAPAKPDPAPVQLAMQRLNVNRAWMIGDAPDDVRAARSAGVLPLGIVTPGEDSGESTGALMIAGASRVVDSVAQLEGLLPQLA